MKRYLISAGFFPALIIVLLFQGCEKSGETPDKQNNGFKGTLSGLAQKGPFISGSSVSLYDLNPDLSASGKTYLALISDDRGSFEISHLSLSSSYARLRVDGYYYNEVTGEKSASPLTLYALADLEDSAGVNVNLLTHLEMPRTEYLIGQGMSFDSAKAQAQSEVLKVFCIGQDSIQPSELLNIFNPGDGDAKLLAMSVLLQGFRTEAELTELLSYLSMDLRTDGVLTDSSLGSQISNHPILLDTAFILNNLTNRSAELGLNRPVPAFEKYITGFIESAAFPVTGSPIEYPETGAFGKNLLALGDTLYTSEYSLSLAAKLPSHNSLKIIIKGLSADPGWGIVVGSGANWSISDFRENLQIFYSINSGTDCDLHMENFHPGKYLIEYYESTAKRPTRSKIITF